MDMMSCPHCGVANSRKRAHCYQCEQDLHAPPRTPPRGGVTCARCGLTAAAAPPGRALSRDQVWCTYRVAAVLSTAAAGTCFQEAFGWSREQILD
jgi:hypothetical protein